MFLGCLNPKASCRHTCAGVPRSVGIHLMFFLMRWKVASAGIVSHCERITSYCFVQVLWHIDAKTWKPSTSFVSWFGYVCFKALHAQFLLGATRGIWRDWCSSWCDGCQRGRLSGLRAVSVFEEWDATTGCPFGRHSAFTVLWEGLHVLGYIELKIKEVTKLGIQQIDTQLFTWETFFYQNS